jgi:HAD domain in Swiss Army Knife RNA repair proteins
MKTNDELVKAMEAADRAARASRSIDQIYGVRAGLPPIAPWPVEACRIVFLDLDGVLNSERSVQLFRTRYRFAKANVAALNEILLRTDARFVITSSWREGLTLGEITAFLERDGVLAGRLAGQTRILQKPRGAEIDAWLRAVPYPVSSFVILDDHDDMEPHRKRLVQTNPNCGINMTDTRRAIELLV